MISLPNWQVLKSLQEQIEAGLSQEEIKKTWADGLTHYDKMRQPYMLYE